LLLLLWLLIAKNPKKLSLSFNAVESVARTSEWPMWLPRVSC
jgi:hypothetical protein